MLDLDDITAPFTDLDAALEARIQRSLEAWGVFILTDYASAAECAARRAELDHILETRRDIHYSESDGRVFAAEFGSEGFRAFKHDEALQAIASRFVGHEQRSLFVMSNRLRSINGVKRRSGGDWHRDRMAPQFKALVYLSDVSPDNGPFSIFPKSNETWPYGPICRDTGFDYFAIRWDDETFAPFLERAGDYLKIITAAAGTCVLFNSSLIHSGQPIQAGMRYAMTNYYYAEDDLVMAKVRKKWGKYSFAEIEKPDFNGGAK